MKKFTIRFDSTVGLEIDPLVFSAALNPDWARQFYLFTNEQQVAEFVAYNVLVNRLRLSEIDGFADLKNELVKVVKLETVVA